jgi:galactose mutarotase-like enzyme
MIELVDSQAASSVSIEPERGGIVTRFRVGDREILFMDDATLRDPSKNVRGGVPVLFPTPGKLANDAWSRDARSGSLKQHGFARELPWSVVDSSKSSTHLRLESNEVTRAQFPWDFALDFRHSLEGRVLRIDQRIENRSSSPMPFGMGFHPYFRVPQSEKVGVRIETKAKRAFDNVTKKTIDLVSIDLTSKEIDLHLLDHGCTESALLFSQGLGEIRVRASAEFTRWVVWTLQGRDFVCLEPWTCPGNAMNTGEGLMVLAPGAVRELWMEIAG